jgi:hypothetical protein
MGNLALSSLRGRQPNEQEEAIESAETLGRAQSQGKTHMCHSLMYSKSWDSPRISSSEGPQGNMAAICGTWVVRCARAEPEVHGRPNP